MDAQLGTISENAFIGDCYQCAKFHACIKKKHNLPEILSYAAGPKWNITKLRNTSFGNEH